MERPKLPKYLCRKRSFSRYWYVLLELIHFSEAHLSHIQDTPYILKINFEHYKFIYYRLDKVKSSEQALERSWVRFKAFLRTQNVKYGFLDRRSTSTIYFINNNKAWDAIWWGLGGPGISVHPKGILREYELLDKLLEDAKEEETKKRILSKYEAIKDLYSMLDSSPSIEEAIPGGSLKNYEKIKKKIRS